MANTTKKQPSEGIPSSIRIFGRDIPVKFAELADNAGLYQDGVILLDHSEIEKGTALSTIFHEAIHCALDIGGIKWAVGPEMEEAIVRCIENGLYEGLAEFLAANKHKKGK